MEHSPTGEEGVLSPSDSVSSDPNHEGETTVNQGDVSSVSSFSAIATTPAVTTATAPGEAINYKHHNRSTTPLRQCRQVRRIHRHSSKGLHPATSSECETVGKERLKCNRRSSPSTLRTDPDVTAEQPLTHTGYPCRIDSTPINGGQPGRGTTCEGSFRTAWCNHYGLHGTSTTNSINAPSNAQCCASYSHSVCGPQTPGCQSHSHTHCFAGHEWHCDLQHTQHAAAANNGFWMNPRNHRSNASGCAMGLCVAAVRHSQESGWRPDNCCAQRIRRGGYISPAPSCSALCRKKQVPTGQVSSYDCHNCLAVPPAHSRSKPLKTPKRPKEQRVHARRIRHPPCDDSNSESELNGPVIDVRALRPAASRLSTVSFPPGQHRQLSNSRTFQAITSAVHPSTPRPAKVYSCPGLVQIQTSTSLKCNAHVHENPKTGEPKTDNNSQSHSSSSCVSNDGGTNSSSFTCSYTESSSSTSLPQQRTQKDTKAAHRPVNPYISYPCQMNSLASTSQPCQHYDSHIQSTSGQPYSASHHDNQYAANTNVVVAPAIPAVSSGDFQNIRRICPRNRSQQHSKCGRRPDIAYFTSRVAQDLINHVGHAGHGADWRSLSQSLNRPAGQIVWNTRSGYGS